MKANIVSTEDVTPNTRKSPATLMIESLDGEYKTMRDMSERYGVHLETMRRVCRAKYPDGSKRLKAPSQVAKQGGLMIYLFDDKDVSEVDAYMAERGYEPKGDK